MSDRRKFLKNSALAVTSALLFQNCGTNDKSGSVANKAMNSSSQNSYKKNVIDVNTLTEPLIIERVELLEYEGNYICRVSTKNGYEGLSVSNNMQMKYLYPIFTGRIQPFFKGKDARNIEQLLDELYIYKSNYKLQGLALWVPFATIEFALLDLLGKASDKSIGELFGKIYNESISIYSANNNRGETAEKSVEKIKKRVEKYGAKAVKFKIGGRMGGKEVPEGRTEKLIPMIREALGDEMTIYCDANGGYDVASAVRIGKILEEYKIDFFEEPVPFDDYQGTIEVAKKLKVPIAGGEQEPSLYNFKQLIETKTLEIVQPDIFYFGGMIRSMKVALLAEKYGLQCIPHISGSGLGYLYMLHFVSAIPNAGPYHEFKGLNDELPFECKTSDLQIKEGQVKVPTGPGSGVDIDADYIKKHRVCSIN